MAAERGGKLVVVPEPEQLGADAVDEDGVGPADGDALLARPKLLKAVSPNAGAPSARTASGASISRTSAMRSANVSSAVTYAARSSWPRLRASR